jgi:hypothetical protein
LKLETNLLNVTTPKLEKNEVRVTRSAARNQNLDISIVETDDKPRRKRNQLAKAEEIESPINQNKDESDSEIDEEEQYLEQDETDNSDKEREEDQEESDQEQQIAAEEQQALNPKVEEEVAMDAQNGAPNPAPVPQIPNPNQAVNQNADKAILGLIKPFSGKSAEVQSWLAN